jgi:hypothetical protein
MLSACPNELHLVCVFRMLHILRINFISKTYPYGPVMLTTSPYGLLAEINNNST